MFKCLAQTDPFQRIDAEQLLQQVFCYRWHTEATNLLIVKHLNFTELYFYNFEMWKICCTDFSLVFISLTKKLPRFNTLKMCCTSFLFKLSTRILSALQQFVITDLHKPMVPIQFGIQNLTSLSHQAYIASTNIYINLGNCVQHQINCHGNKYWSITSWLPNIGHQQFRHIYLSYLWWCAVCIIYFKIYSWCFCLISTWQNTSWT